MTDPKPRKPRKPRTQNDIAIVSGPTEDGQGARVLRIREGAVSVGEIRPVKEGESITHNEVVRLHPLETDPRVCEVEVLHAPALPENTTSESAKPEALTTARRARVSTASYRKNWTTIFDQKSKRGAKSDDWSVN